MILRIELDDENYVLHLQQNGTASDYKVSGVVNASGTASVVETSAGVYSVLLGERSLTIHLAQKGDEIEVWAGLQRHRISIQDARDRSSGGKKSSAAGPQEIRAQMPGKVIKLLAGVGESVRAGQGVIVVEAMKMQNEMKSPKDGVLSKIAVEEGATVAAGETLMVVE